MPISHASAAVAPLSAAPFPPKNARPRYDVRLSAALVRIAWVPIMCFHVVELVVTTALGGVHLLVSLPTSAEAVSHAQIPTSMLKVSGWSFLFLAVCHAIEVVRMLYDLVKPYLRLGRLNEWRTRLRRSMRSRSQHRERASLCSRLTAAVMRIAFACGIHGEYFDPAFQLRELLEIVLQTYQLFYMSRSVDSRWVNELAVAIVVLNCLMTVVIDAYMRRRDQLRRLANILIDMGFDFCWAVVIPVALLLPYALQYNWEIGLFPSELGLDDVWQTKAVATVRQVLITSPIDYVSSLLPRVSFLSSLALVRRLVSESRAQRRWRMLRATAFIRPGGNATASKETLARGPSALDVSAPNVRRRVRYSTAKIRDGVYHLVLVGWALFVIVAHCLAQHDPVTFIPECRLPLNAWLAQHEPCAVVQINCYEKGIQGSSSELASTLAQLDRDLLAKITIVHCPALHIPAILTQFSRLQSIETFNCSIVDWSMDAAVTQAHHSRLAYVHLLATNMTELPIGLAHGTLPKSLAHFRIHQSNLTRLPDDLGALWSSKSFFSVSFEHTPITSLPSSFDKLRTFELNLISNKIESIPDHLFAQSAFGAMTLSGNPLRQLPASFGDITSLKTLLVEWTNVSVVPAWIQQWAARREAATASSSFLSFFGSPACSEAGASRIRNFCATDQHSNLSSINVDVVYRKRTLARGVTLV